MKDCCEKWVDVRYATLKGKTVLQNFCPECGSSLKYKQMHHLQEDVVLNSPKPIEEMFGDFETFEAKTAAIELTRRVIVKLNEVIRRSNEKN